MAYDKVIDSAELDADLTSVADAIRAKGGTSEQMSFPDGFVSAVEGIQAGGGDDSLLLSILDRSITELSDGGMTTLGKYALSDCVNLTDVNLNNVKTLSDYALQRCTSLTKLEFPNLETAGVYCFSGCSSLAEVNFPKVKTMGQHCFSGCTSITAVTFPEATSTIHSGFTWSNFVYAYFPKATTVHARSFWNTGLPYIDLPSANSIGNQAFQNCASLKTVILRSESVASLATINALPGTPFAEGGSGGVLLVPSDLVESYKTATNWSVIYGYGTNRFLALEDYTVDGTTTGEIDWDKVNALFEEV